MLFAWSFSTFLDWLQGSPPAGGADGSIEQSRRRQPRPRPRSIPWRPVDGEDPGELFETGWPDEVFVLQSVFPAVRQHVPQDPGEQRYGFLLGRRLECPATDDPYLLIDEIWAAPDPLRERGGTAEFEAALERARTKATKGEKDVLGWFHTHSPLLGLQFSEHDVRLHARFFPEKWHCALIEVVHGEVPVGGLFQRRQKHRYPGTKLVSFLEVTPGGGSGRWGEMTSQLDWRNYDTPRSDVRRVPAPRKPAPVIRPRGGDAAAAPPADDGVERRRPPSGPSWRWLPLTSTGGAEDPERRPTERPPISRPAASADAVTSEVPAEDAAPWQIDAPEPPPARPERSRASRERTAAEAAAEEAQPAAAEKAETPAAEEAKDRAEETEAPAEEAQPTAPAGRTARAAPRESATTRRPHPAPPPRRGAGLPFSLEPSEATASSGSLARAVDGLNAVVAARRRAAASEAPTSAGGPPRSFERDSLPFSDVPVVMAAGEEWPQPGFVAAEVAPGDRRWRLLLLIPLLAVGVFFFVQGEGGGETLAPEGFHPAAGPPEAGRVTSAGRTEFDRLRSTLEESLTAYGERRAEFQDGSVGCAALDAAFRTTQRDYVRLSDLIAEAQTRLGSDQRQTWRSLVVRTAEVDRHFGASGCERRP